MRAVSINLLVAFSTVCVFSHATAQIPDWADKRLTTRDGLVLWLDANAIPAARKATHSTLLPNGGALEQWSDASGNGRHFLQASTGDQPQLVPIGDAWSVRFDGETDHMRCLSVPGKIQSATLFIVAAPHDNFGEFRGLFATNAPQKRDYESGLTVDLGAAPSAALEYVNVEGSGFGGARNLLKGTQRFGSLQTLETVFDPQSRKVTLSIDGKQAGERSFEPNGLSIDQLTLAARFYTNGPGEHIVRGPLKCDIAEVLFYDRVLSNEERASVRAYLTAKHANLADRLPAELKLTPGVALVKAENPPLIQMFVPGFTVRELPIELTNVNNVRYREDGRLMTLGYNGDLHLLSDTDGDGVEDKAELFWKNSGSLRGPLGMLLTPPGYAKGCGVFVPSKGKVSLIVDTNGDDKADEEIVIATGWKEIAQNVDAVGITMDKEGAIYFGLGTANYANAYMVDDSGKAEYDIKSERGTVQRISPDFSKRETVCTGIRFPIAFAFNDAGDLFCSEQEGATWLPNGNPLDELLHIQTGRHYGFPPRHPRHNPDVIDEPSTFDYGPQHQSTCGMVFNKSVNGGPVFGPAAWARQALVCGESRGKLWRTQLFKTEAGYVASTQLFAGLQMLTIDGCVAPDGDFVVACHSGPPDWGTGPTGIGKLFRIKYSDLSAPQPVATWAESPNEIRIAFDRPIDPLKMRKLVEQIKVEFGEFVRAGDRFETLVPPYAVVKRQLATPRFELPVAGASLTNDLRTLIVSTATMKANSHYAVTLPRPEESQDSVAKSTIHSQIDLDLSLTGVQATWTPKDASQAVLVNDTSWLPHLNLQVAREFTQGSSQHDALWSAMESSGELMLRTNLDLHHLLRPVVQPGSKIDYEWPAESVTLVISSPQPITVSSTLAKIESQSSNGVHVVRLTFSGDAAELVDLEIKLTKTTDAKPQLDVSVHTAEDSRDRPMPLNRFYIPWVKSKEATQLNDDKPMKIAEIEGGNWGLGRRVFHSEAAGCFKCHAMGGVGAKIGPDLANLVHRDYASVLRDIVNPSFAINPDYIGHLIAMNDGQILTGVLRDEAGQLILGDEKGNSTKIVRSDIDQMRPAKLSVMPTGLSEKLSKEQLRDLMTFLLTSPPRMPLEGTLQAPPVRSQADLAAVLAGAPPLPKELKPLKIVLVSGKKDHGPGEHDYPAWQMQWGQLMAAAPNVEISAAWDFPSEEQLATADTLIFFQKGTWNDNRAMKLDAFQARGGGSVYIHWAVNGDDRVVDFSKRIGLASKGGSIGYRHGPLTLEMHNTDHPILRNIDQLKLYDESYWRLTGEVKNVTLLATSSEEGEATPQIWAYEKGAGHVFVSIPGHYSWTFDDPIFRVLLLRGIAWTARESVDRFNELVPLGARLSK
jgi:putative heme-binding domain-containing protein